MSGLELSLRIRCCETNYLHSEKKLPVKIIINSDVYNILNKEGFIIAKEHQNFGGLKDVAMFQYISKDKILVYKKEELTKKEISLMPDISKIKTPAILCRSGFFARFKNPIAYDISAAY